MMRVRRLESDEVVATEAASPSRCVWVWASMLTDAVIGKNGECQFVSVG